jgi:hypothetical protein
VLITALFLGTNPVKRTLKKFTVTPFFVKYVGSKSCCAQRSLISGSTPVLAFVAEMFKAALT